MIRVYSIVSAWKLVMEYKFYIILLGVIRYSVAAIPACGGGVCMPCTNVVLVSILVS